MKSFTGSASELLTENILELRKVEEKNYKNVSGDDETILLRRLALGLNYSPVIKDIAEIIEFGFLSIVDFLSPISISIWKNNKNHRWIALASCGEEFPLPSAFDSWSEINQTAMLMRESLIIYVDGQDSNTEDLVHWVIPVLIPGISCYVLHLLTPRSRTAKDKIEIFLNAFALIAVNCDTREWTINGDQSNHRTAKGKHSLTLRQKEILRLADEDFTYAQIARRLGFSESTIKKESMKIFKLLGVRNKNEALEVAKS